MEYKKEYNNFSFGIGSKKVAGKGSLENTESENTSLLNAVAVIAITVGAGLLKIILKNKHKKR